MLSSSLGPRCRPQQLAKVEVAVRGERPHVELVGQGQRFAVAMIPSPITWLTVPS